ncbi:pectin lyase fold/virulence factor [Flagelloscypha sp. PMI_526]|nr:pectin lyase fold/virulence factor [Flagelloscypha sp. PMI_526]
MQFTWFKVAVSFLSLTTSVNAVGSPVGFGRGTTGGAAATAATPSSLAELVTWLSDSTTRNIQISTIYDFTNYYGTKSATACSPWTCTPNPQKILGTCDSGQQTVTVYKAGTDNRLHVGSNKSLIGVGSNAGIKGIGLEITGSTNVIIQSELIILSHNYIPTDTFHEDIKITDINHQYVWGGDGLLISNATKVWIDHNYFNRPGRQFITTGFGNAASVTISNNKFDGTATYSNWL